MTIVSASGVDTVVRALRPRLGERLLLPDDAGFGGARRVWNAAVTHRPALIARCRDTAEVAAAVRAARDAGLPLSVRAGGHDWAGRAVRDGGLVVDLTGLRGAAADPVARTVTVEGGATTADLLAAAAPHGLVTATGVVGSVGVAGLSTVGGYGPLVGRFGLALDNLLGAEVVLADGSTVTAGPDGDPELWWALRGGGGNFGVVTRLRFRLHELPAVLAGMLLFPAAQGRAVLSGYAGIVAAAPDDLTVMTGFLPGPDGPMAFLCPFWSGADLAAGARAVDALRALGRPVVDQVGTMPYAAALRMFDASIVDGNHYLLRSRWLADLSPAAADALVAGAAELTSPFSTLIVNRFHGAAARVDPAATAFANRVPHQVVEVIAAWPAQDTAERHRAWADSVVAALDPVALPGGYPNLLGPGDDTRARDAYGGNLDRLLAAKRRYDPDNVFSAIPALLD
ncbi:FAD-binding oxidoreductase [Dactylosporangium aurantiacum]|uniref:FAD-binding oxidoreductase n=1 Tax=Dactylosporangium aurantiacum TaxID=35754 RepID=A0A9Q9MI54_9ACTN|nr:FAD-binding oxidoreductase [Dactylosporangium aurantiacum]MDG6107465.1 FAD-binding oxidoreductase [Dactylosporangium aurantiacum]UWZ60203.1 FAD-binding oxidoreductase [Dactylosporangium aurantiacum]